MKHVGCAHKCHTKMHTRAQVTHPKSLPRSLLARKKGRLGTAAAPQLRVLHFCSWAATAGFALQKGRDTELALINHNTAAGFSLGIQGFLQKCTGSFLQQTQPCAS